MLPGLEGRRKLVRWDEKGALPDRNPYRSQKSRSLILPHDITPCNAAEAIAGRYSSGSDDSLPLPACFICWLNWYTWGAFRLTTKTMREQRKGGGTRWCCSPDSCSAPPSLRCRRLWLDTRQYSGLRLGSRSQALRTPQWGRWSWKLLWGLGAYILGF